MHALGSALSFGMITLLFAMMFKWLPDADVAWRDVWLGAIGTAALFEIGKFLIGFAHLGLLLGADRPVRRRIHACPQPAAWPAIAYR